MGALLLTTVTTCVAVALTILVVQARPLGEDEIQVHLNRLNKPAVRTIRLGDGETIDCVDIYKQPAFDHPFLKDHKIIMSPSFAINNSGQYDVIQPEWHQSEGCPDGTIPIRRVQRGDLIRSRSLDGFGTLSGDRELIERAGVFTDLGPYNGIRADVTVWPVTVETDEWSRAGIQLIDLDENINVEAGWMVNPSLFGDSYPRIFSYWTTDAYGETGCFNLLCSGFVQLGREVVLGSVITPLSTYGGQVYKIAVTINKDDVNQLWWLVIQGSPVGYWPMSIFVQFGDFFQAQKMLAGGAVLNRGKLSGTHTTTQMGSGRFAEEGWGKAAAIKQLELVDTSNKVIVNPYTLAGVASRLSCYNFQFDNPTLIFYGGPGGHQC